MPLQQWYNYGWLRPVCLMGLGGEDKSRGHGNKKKWPDCICAAVRSTGGGEAHKRERRENQKSLRGQQRQQSPSHFGTETWTPSPFQVACPYCREELVLLASIGVLYSEQLQSKHLKPSELTTSARCTNPVILFGLLSRVRFFVRLNKKPTISQPALCKLTAKAGSLVQIILPALIPRAEHAFEILAENNQLWSPLRKRGGRHCPG